MNTKELKEQVELLFTRRSSLLLLWQELSENFYPERADFTFRRSLGTDFAAGLTTSYPLLCRRDLGDQVSTMRRPTAKAWFHMKPNDIRREDHEAKLWLQWAEQVQRRAMYDPQTLFKRATVEADHDFACFGQAAMSIRLNRDRNALLYRTFHLRDMAWMEDETGKISLVARKWCAKAIDLARTFGRDKLHRKVQEQLEQGKPFAEFDCYHIMVTADLFEPGGPGKQEKKAKGKPWWSVYMDIANDHDMEIVAQWNKEYIIPRWQTVSGSQYAFSPATIAALPDARLTQAMAYTLLEAGEKATNPPMVATQDAVRSDVAIYPGGITWVDRDYDERLGDALRPMTVDSRGMPIGIDMQRDSRAMIAQAFYLNKLTLPQRTPEMTAYEVGQRVQEYIRGALPLFEPMEMDYNGQMCDVTFDLLMRGGAFGSPYSMPKSLQGAEITFGFASPLHDAIEAQKGQKFLEVKSYIAQAIELDPASATVVNAVESLRDVLESVGAPQKWIRSESQVEDMKRQQQAQAATEQALAGMESASQTALNLGGAQKAMAEAQPAI